MNEHGVAKRTPLRGQAWIASPMEKHCFASNKMFHVKHLRNIALTLKNVSRETSCWMGWLCLDEVVYKR